MASKSEEALKAAGYEIVETSPHCYRWSFDDGSEKREWSEIVWVQVDYDPVLVRGMERDSRNASAEAEQDALNDAVHRGLLSI